MRASTPARRRSNDGSMVGWCGFAPARPSARVASMRWRPGQLPVLDKLALCQQLFDEVRLPLIVRVTPMSQPRNLDGDARSSGPACVRRHPGDGPCRSVDAASRAARRRRVAAAGRPRGLRSDRRPVARLSARATAVARAAPGAVARAVRRLGAASDGRVHRSGMRPDRDRGRHGRALRRVHRRSGTQPRLGAQAVRGSCCTVRRRRAHERAICR